MEFGPKRNEESKKTMARYTGPKNRLARREGVDLGFKTVGSNAHASLLRRLTTPPGVHGAKRKGATSNFGIQLREKQKAKRLYSVMERQFRNYFTEASKQTGNTGLALLQRLETRLDNIVYRLSLAPTRASARQLVNHRHVVVNGKTVGIPSYHVMINDVVALKPKALTIPAVTKLLDEKNPVIPGWLERKGPVGKLLHVPDRAQLDLDINESLIVEYYSR